jgi:GAF domain-containing protein
VASIAARLHGLGEQLTVRSASRQARTALRLGALDAYLTFTGDAPLIESHLGPRRRSDAVVDAALRLVTTLAQATVSGADGVSVSLHRHGGMMTVAASDERIAQMDRDQYATRQGPCLAAAATGRPVAMPVLAADGRWPAFTSRARTAGIASILSSPLISDQGPVGALNMYSRTEHAFGVEQRRLAALFAAQASTIIVEAADARAEPEITDRLRTGLRDREVIALAQGVLMGRDGSTAEEAHGALRVGARSRSTTVAGEAARVLRSTAPARGPVDDA